MAKKFQISAEEKNGKALIRIVGRISRYWNDSDDFRYKVDQLVEAGITDVELYLKGVGGDTFEAAEIVNIIKQFKGKIDGRGGSLVASAYTYIALHCDTFTLASNSQWMIHKPHGFIEGNEDEIEARLKLLKNITKDYVRAYSKKTGKSEEDMRELMKSDYWLTAEEAKEQGFVNDVEGEEEITSEDILRMEACNAPIIPKNNVKSKSKKMEINPLLIGLKADATKEQIEARLLELNRKAGETDSLKEQAVAEKKRKHDAEIKAIIDKAVTEKRIQESQRKNFEDFAAANFESFKSAIEGLHPIGAISKELNTSSSKPELGDRDYGWYLENDVKALEKIEKDEPEKFEALVNAYYQ